MHNAEIYQGKIFRQLFRKLSLPSENSPSLKFPKQTQKALLVKFHNGTDRLIIHFLAEHSKVQNCALFEQYRN